MAPRNTNMWEQGRGEGGGYAALTLTALAQPTTIIKASTIGTTRQGLKERVQLDSTGSNSDQLATAEGRYNHQPSEYPTFLLVPGKS
jgi:hypothetical protein